MYLQMHPPRTCWIRWDQFSHHIGRGKLPM
ncbi:unnamed protein product, partial [Rotaria sp. Silwood2]